MTKTEIVLELAMIVVAIVISALLAWWLLKLIALFANLIAKLSGG